MPFPPRQGVRGKDLCPPGTSLGFLRIQEKAAALAASVLNIELSYQGLIGRDLPSDWGPHRPRRQGQRERLLDCLLRLLAHAACFHSLQ